MAGDGTARYFSYGTGCGRARAGRMRRIREGVYVRTVLFVGEPHSLPELEATMLARSELEVRAVTAPEAVAGAALRGADLVILDPQLPGLDPEMIVAAIRAGGRESVRVLVVATPSARSRFEEAAADGFVSRPLTTARLLDAVRRHVALVERGEERVAFATKVDFERAGGAGAGYAHDLSREGLFLVTGAPLAAGEEIGIGFVLPHPEARPIRSRARVVRAGAVGSPAHHAAGFGLAFVDLAGEHRAEISRWLRRKDRA